MKLQPANNTAYALRSLQSLDLRDFAPFGRNVVYAGNVKRNGRLKKEDTMTNQKINFKTW